MADVFLTYQKKRKEFGRCPTDVFEDVETQLVGKVQQDVAMKSNYTPKDPNTVILTNIPDYSIHSVNTDRVATSNKGMRHVEGGWPGGVDYTEPQDVKKHLKKIDKEKDFSQSVGELKEGSKSISRQNNQIDLYEEYFRGETPDQSIESISTKTLMLFKDPCDYKRSISKIGWNPENQNKLAIAYSVLRFQQMGENMPMESYIWDTTNPNFPERTLSPTSPLCTLSYNPKNPEILAGGSYNGVVSIWDFRLFDKNRPAAETFPPTDCSEVEKSHHDPVYDIFWIHGKTGTDFVTTSTDGRVCWWDTRKLKEGVTDEILLESLEGKIWGGTRLEYHVEAGPMKYLVGTEQGYVVQVNKRSKKPTEITHRYGVDMGKHHGPICAIQRCPTAHKYFLTVGDWAAKVWFEDIRTPLINTKYHDSYLTDGVWSPTRAGLFFLTRNDGWLDIWDYYYRQNEVAFSHKICDSALTSISIKSTGNLAAIGDATGTVTLMELCDSLYIPQSRNEKNIIASMLEREQRREKNLETQKKVVEKKVAEKDPKKEENKKKRIDERIANLEASFFSKLDKGREQPSQSSKLEEIRGQAPEEEKKEEPVPVPAPAPQPPKKKESKEQEKEVVQPTQIAKPSEEVHGEKEEE